MISSRTNKLTATIGGEEKVFKYGMNASEKLQSLLQAQPGLLENTFTLLKHLFLIGIECGGNKGEPLDLGSLGDLMDDMDGEEFEKVKDFAFRCLGFTMNLNLTAAETVGTGAVVTKQTGNSPAVSA